MGHCEKTFELVTDAVKAVKETLQQGVDRVWENDPTDHMNGFKEGQESAKKEIAQLQFEKERIGLAGSTRLTALQQEKDQRRADCWEAKAKLERKINQLIFGDLRSIPGIWFQVRLLSKPDNALRYRVGINVENKIYQFFIFSFQVDPDFNKTFLVSQIFG